MAGAGPKSVSLIKCFDDVTPILHDLTLGRGYEIQAWLNEHSDV
jgi:hypothetical protein